jgi:hypothetical protein
VGVTASRRNEAMKAIQRPIQDIGVLALILKLGGSSCPCSWRKSQPQADLAGTTNEMSASLIGH